MNNRLNEATAAAKRGLPDSHRPFKDSNAKYAEAERKTPMGRRSLQRKAEHHRQTPKPLAISGTKSGRIARQERNARVSADNARVLKHGLTKKQKALTRAINNFEENILVSYLIDEGYAKTTNSAKLIMENMSENWKNFILA